MAQYDTFVESDNFKSGTCGGSRFPSERIGIQLWKDISFSLGVETIQILEQALFVAHRASSQCPASWLETQTFAKYSYPSSSSSSLPYLLL